MGLSILVLLFLGIAQDGFQSSVQGFIRIQSHPGRLINDFTLVGGTGGAFFNAAVMTILSLFLVRSSGIRISGPTLAATFTIMGFALFGKTPTNALPIVFGVVLAAKLAGKPFKNYILFALFGTALGPVVSFFIAEIGLGGFSGFVAGYGVGTVVGFFLPAVGIVMLRMHEGYNLYNIGLTAGFLGLFVAGVFRASNMNVDIEVLWNREPTLAHQLLVPLFSVLFLLGGIIRSPNKILINQKKILKSSGRLPSDFVDSATVAGALVNMGLLGLVASGYMALVGADFNGPTLGGLLTLFGFGAFGKHLRNTLPIFAGVVVATLLFGKSLVAPGPILAFLFATTLAPLAGEFGPLIGFAAGFVHLVMVEQSAAWHGGVDLYNNGFAGGLTATLFVAVIQWVKANKS